MTAARSRLFAVSGFGANGAARSLGKPTAAYPAAVATDSDLMIAVDRQQTRLALPLNTTDTQMTVMDPSILSAYNLLTIDNEIVKTIGTPTGNIVPIQRGFDGTTPAVHLASATVSGFIDAYHHNRLVAEVEAIEQTLGANLSRIPAVPFLVSSNYDFPAQTPGGNLIVGNNVITLTPVPLGVNGTDTGHYLYISGGTGTAEPVLITGGTAVSGAASGTVIVTCANTHSGAWTIRSATAGGSEAVSYGAQNAMVYFPAGTYTLRAPIVLTNGHVTLLGAGRDVTNFIIPNTFPLSVTGVFQGTVPGVHAGQLVPEYSRMQYAFRNFSMRFTQPDSGDATAMTQYPYAIYLDDIGLFRIENVTLELASKGVNITRSCGGAIDHLWFMAFSVGLNIDTTVNDVAIDDLRSWIFGGTHNQNSAYANNANYIAVQLGAADGFQMQNSLIYAGQLVRNLSGGNNTGSFRIANTVFDQIHGLIFNTGFTDLVNCWIINFDDLGTGAASGQAMTLNGGMVSISNSFMQHVNSQVPFAQINFASAPQSGANVFRVTGCNIVESNTQDRVMFRSVAANTATNLIFFENNTIYKVDGSFGQAILHVDKGTASTVALHFSGNKMVARGGGNAPLLTIVNDGPHQIYTGQLPAGWYVSYPAMFAQAITDANLGAAVASAATIAPSSRSFTVSGTAAITTMSIPVGFRAGETITMIPTAAFTWTSGGAAGNFAKAGTAVVGQTITCTLMANSVWATSY